MKLPGFTHRPEVDVIQCRRTGALRFSDGLNLTPHHGLTNVKDAWLKLGQRVPKSARVRYVVVLDHPG